MDLESIGFITGNNEPFGRPKFDLRDLLKLYIYGYFNSVKLSRKLAKQSVINREVILFLKDFNLNIELLRILKKIMLML